MKTDEAYKPYTYKQIQSDRNISTYVNYISGLEIKNGAVIDKSWQYRQLNIIRARKPNPVNEEENEGK